MKNPIIFFIILCLGLSSGCSHLPSFGTLWPFGEDSKEETKKTEVEHQDASGTQETDKFYISPEVKLYVTEAKKYWSESGECVNAQEALKYLDAAISIDPLDNEIRLLRCQALAEGNYLEEAFNEATNVIRRAPSAKAYAVRGLVSVKSHEQKGALRDFGYAEKIDPKEPLIYLFRARLHFSENKNFKGCNELEKACSLGMCNPFEKAKKDKICE